jgi:hypothetical protein
MEANPRRFVLLRRIVKSRLGSETHSGVAEAGSGPPPDTREAESYRVISLL